jgi:hypothetical protein
MLFLLAVLLHVLPGGDIAGTPPTAERVHPMHTAVVEIAYQPASGLAAIQIRVFRDDFSNVAGGPKGTPIDSSAAAYVRSVFHIIDHAGRTLPLYWQSAEQSGDVVVLRLTAPAPAGLHGAEVSSALLCDRFEDQVNIVRASYEGRTSTLIFIRGDRAKALP